ncbi:hypothetical protein ON010_g16733 [Phytophthora cinnamomi]|nr:hypothetical protein ON010_g16733 [Phytophthora cinnamomi]
MTGLEAKTVALGHIWATGIRKGAVQLGAPAVLALVRTTKKKKNRTGAKMKKARAVDRAAAAGAALKTQDADGGHAARARQLLPRHLAAHARYGELQVSFRAARLGGSEGDSCCFAFLALNAEPWQQQHLQLVVSLDSELLVLQPQPAERESANLLLTVAGRPESGGTPRQVNDDAAVLAPNDFEPVIEMKRNKKLTKRRKRQAGAGPPSPSRQAGAGPPSPTRAARSTNQQSPPRQQRPKVAWSEHDVDVDDEPPALLPPDRSNSKRVMDRGAADSLAADVARRETPSRIFKMERYRVVTPVFPRQYMLDPPLSPLPLIQPTGGHRMTGGDLEVEQRDRETYAGDISHSPNADCVSGIFSTTPSRRRGY